MRFDNVSILALAHVDAPHRVSSAELEEPLVPTFKRLGMPQNLIESLTGVKARRFWDRGTQPSDGASLAGEEVLRVSGIDRAQIGALINTSVCRDYVEPSVACFVHDNLKLDRTCINFDVANACLGFLDGMQLVGNMIERGQIRYGMVVDAESSRHVVEQTVARMQSPGCDAQMLREQIATLTVGSGAAAMILAHSDLVPDGHQFLGGVSRADTRHNQLCRGTLDTGITDTQGMLSNGVELARQTWRDALEELQWTPESVDLFALHQVSQLHTVTLARTLEFDLSRTYLLYPEFGNMGPASLPIALSKAANDQRINRGDRVVLGGIGSGLNCTAAGVIW